MHLTDLNRHSGIGSNCFLAEIGPFRVIMDCGFHPKKIGREVTPDLDKLPDNSVDIVVLTHCHLDHLGAIPLLLRRHPNAVLVCSQPTFALAPVLLKNSVKVMTRQRQEKGIRDLPLYTAGEVDRCGKQFHPMAFGRPRIFEKGGDEIEITLFPAGHVAGAAGVLIRHHHRKIFFTGDVHFTPQQTVSGAKFPEGPFDTVVMETTRGANPPVPGRTRESEIERFLDICDRTVAHGGSILIPVFALGRCQEVLSILADARKRRRVRECPVLVAGLGMTLCDLFDDIGRRTGLIRFSRNVLKQLSCKRPRMGEEFSADRPPRIPSILVLSSGMLVERTPSYDAACSLLGGARNTICFVGYCDPDTPGGKLLATPAGQPFCFEANDRIVRVQARVERIDLTGHADRDSLLDFAVKSEARAVVLTHGEDDARKWFAGELAQAMPKAKVHDPVSGLRTLV